MYNDSNLGKSFTAAICAVLFSATMVLSAVGPAEAKARDAATGATSRHRSVACSLSGVTRS
ncbi:MAG: hypothetical protein U5M50_02700 [Sphingobium sp.]|nr:hypothetical protein [Sphingobium sp.]